jgi:CRP-like cAMP-binding protein
MPHIHHPLQKATGNRDLARRARQMSRYLTQRSDIERIAAYAAELERRADEIERGAADVGAPSPDNRNIGELANA